MSPNGQTWSKTQFLRRRALGRYGIVKLVVALPELLAVADAVKPFVPDAPLGDNNAEA